MVGEAQVAVGRDATMRGATSALAEIKVANAMRPGVISVSSDLTMRAIAQTMASQRVHCVVVTGRDEAAWGIVSDLDLVRVASEDIDARTAGSVAATEFLTVNPDETLARAAQLMTEHEVTHLVVVDPESQQPAGVLSTLDVASALAG